MGTKAEEEDIKTDDVIADEEVELDPDQESEQDDDPEKETAPEADDDEEVEIVSADDSPTSEESKKRAGPPPRRVRKLLEKTEKLSGEKEALEAQIRLMQMQMQQGKKPEQPAQAPTLESCDWDADKYQKAMEQYIARQSKSVFSEQLSELEKQRQQESQREGRQKALEDHYSRADSMRVKDYDDKESAAINVLGRELVEDIASLLEESHLVIYHLGAREDKAQKIKSLHETNPVAATVALGKLAAGLQVKPKTNSNPKAPDTPLEGGGGPSSAGNWDKKLDQAREKAAKTGDMSHVSAVKKAARAAGVNL